MAEWKSMGLLRIEESCAASLSGSALAERSRCAMSPKNSRMRSCIGGCRRFVMMGSRVCNWPPVHRCWSSVVPHSFE